MSNTALITIPMLILFFGLMIGVGFYCRKNSTNVDGFVLGGRNVGPWLTAFAFGTSYFSAVIFVGYAGQFGWNFGLASTWIGLGNAFIGSLLAWTVLGRRTRVMTQHLGSKTMPDFFEKRYDSKKLKVVASFIVFIFLIPYTASLYNGLSSLFNNVFHIDYWIIVVAMSVLTGVYVIFGGYMATAINDFIQGIIMLAGIIAVIASVLTSHGGFNAAAESLGVKAGTQYTAIFGPNPIFLFFVIMLTSLGTWGLPQMVGKFYSIKNEDSIKKGTVISTVFAIIVAGGCYFLGGFGRLYEPSVKNGKVLFDSIVPTMIKDLPSVIVSLVIVLVLSASMSTLSSLVMASSSTLTLDFIKGKISKNLSEKKQVFIMRVLIVVFIAISAFIAIMQHQSNVTFIAQLMGISWGALAGAFLAPFLYGLYWKRTTKAAVWVNIVFSTVFMILNMLIKSAFPTILQSPINAGAFCMLAGLIIVPVVSLLTKKPDKSQVEEVFSCYDKEVTVTSKHSIGE